MFQTDLSQGAEHQYEVRRLQTRTGVSASVAEAAVQLRTSMTGYWERNGTPEDVFQLNVNEARAIDTARIALQPWSINRLIPDFVHSPSVGHYCRQAREAVRNIQGRGFSLTEGDISDVVNAAARLNPRDNTAPQYCR